MSQKIRVRPTKPVTIMALVVAAAMGLFGLFFMGILINEGAGIGVGFMVLWLAVLAVIIVYYVYNLKSKTGVIEIDTENGTPGIETAADFETRIRKLERLKKDGLLTDDEYRTKRSEILSEKW